MGKADLHIHTTFSWDGTCSVPAVLKQAAHIVGLDVIAITDHDEIEGALIAEELAPTYGIEVIPGCEISTAEGHLLALYIREKVPAGLPLTETVLRVGESGGICVAAHPTAHGTPSLSEKSIREALQHPDVARTLVGIEVFNAGIIHRKGNITAKALADSLPVAQTGSSDSHVLWTIGEGVTYFKGYTSAELRKALETRKTMASSGKGVQTTHLIFSWVRGYALRKAGWVECNYNPNEPVALGRLSSQRHHSISLH